MHTEHIPQLLRTPDLGMFLSVQVGRKWSHIITRDAREVAVKRVRNEVVAAAKVVDYPKGLVVAAEHFLKPELGIAVVTPQAQLILEEIMKVYSDKAGAVRGFMRAGGTEEEITAQVTKVDGKWQFDETLLAAKPKAEKGVKPKPEKVATAPNVKRPIVIKDEAAKPKAEKVTKEPKHGAVWQVHQCCDKHHKALESGKLTRGAAITQIVESGITNGTAQVQIGVWAKKNGVTLTKASRAAE